MTDEFGDAGTITRMRIELHKERGLSAHPRQGNGGRVSSRAPTVQYPIGLEQELRELSS